MLDLALQEMIDLFLEDQVMLELEIEIDILDLVEVDQLITTQRQSMNQGSIEMDLLILEEKKLKHQLKDQEVH